MHFFLNENIFCKIIKKASLWHYFGDMDRISPNTDSDSKVWKCASINKSTASNKAISSLGQPADVKLTEDGAAFCSGTARALRRLKRENKVAGKTVLRL
jgi:hypothetical protein